MKMTKSIKIWRNRLEISKEGRFYMINNSKADLFIHADKLELRQPNESKSWLLMWHKDVYIGSLWINSDTDMKKIKKCLNEKLLIWQRGKK